MGACQTDHDLGGTKIRRLKEESGVWGLMVYTHCLNI